MVLENAQAVVWVSLLPVDVRFTQVDLLLVQLSSSAIKNTHTPAAATASQPAMRNICTACAAVLLKKCTQGMFEGAGGVVLRVAHFYLWLLTSIIAVAQQLVNALSLQGVRMCLLLECARHCLESEGANFVRVCFCLAPCDAGDKRP